MLSMIGYIKGTILTQVPESDRFSYVIVTPQDMPNLGIHVSVPQSALNRLTNTNNIELYLYHYQTPRDQFTVGLTSLAKFKFFLQLLKVTGVGPKLSAYIIEYFNDLNELLDLIALQDISKLAKIPGLGRKKAGKILLEIVDPQNIKQLLAQKQASNAKTITNDIKVPPSIQNILEELVSALTSLGLTQKEAINRILKRQDSIVEHLDNSSSTPEIGEILKILLRK